MGSGLREIVHDNNSSIQQIVAEVRRMNQAMGQIARGSNDAFGQARTDAKISAKIWHRSMNSCSMLMKANQTATGRNWRPEGALQENRAEQSTLLVPSVDQDMNQSNIQDRGLRSLIDLSSIQPQREVPTPLPTLVGGVEGNQRSFKTRVDYGSTERN